MAEKYRIAVACGGTGGHIFPGLATADVLRERGHDVTLWMAGKDIESDAVSEWPGNVITVPAEGFQFGISFRSLLTTWKLYKAYRRSLDVMRTDVPNVVLAMGSYASFGPVMAAKKLKVPYVMHEANLLPGKAVTLFSRKAAALAISFDRSSYYLKHACIEITGMPLREAIESAALEPRQKRNPGDPLRILVMGGSRGAQVLNEIVPKALATAVKKGVALEVEHIAGVQESEEIEQTYRNAGVKATVHHFVQHIEKIYLKTDLAICRSGAATCSELSLFGIPSLLIPYPHAARNHQMGNARALQDTGAADVIAQEDLTSSWLRDYIESVIQKPERLERMRVALIKRVQPDSAARLADLLEKVAAGRK